MKIKCVNIEKYTKMQTGKIPASVKMYLNDTEYELLGSSYIEVEPGNYTGYAKIMYTDGSCDEITPRQYEIVDKKFKSVVVSQSKSDRAKAPWTNFKGWVLIVIIAIVLAIIAPSAGVFTAIIGAVVMQSIPNPRIYNKYGAERTYLIINDNSGSEN